MVYFTQKCQFKKQTYKIQQGPSVFFSLYCDKARSQRNEVMQLVLQYLQQKHKFITGKMMFGATNNKGVI